MAHFALTLIHGQSWDSSRPIREQIDWEAHARFMDSLVEAGVIILGGPVGDGVESLHVVCAADEQELRARLADDPWAAAGLLEVASIRPWQLWLDSR